MGLELLLKAAKPKKGIFLRYNALHSTLAIATKNANAPHGGDKIKRGLLPF